MKPSNANHRFRIGNTIPTLAIPAPAGARAFTRVELLSVIVVLALLAATVLPMLAGSKRVSERVACVSNLERIGQATLAWVGDHGDERPPFLVSATEGGLQSHPLRQNAYFSFIILSNYLDTPRHLVCPADEVTFGAPDWAQFDTPLYRANALSYFIGTDAEVRLPKSLLAGDRHILNGFSQNCGTAQVKSLGLPSRMYNAAVHAQLRWDEQAIHGATGNVLCADGQVVQASSAGLRTLLNNQLYGDLNGSNHVLPPR